MKKHIRLLTLILTLAVVVGCEPSNDPRWEQTPAKSWKATSTPDDQDVKAESYSNYDLNQGFALLKDSAKNDLTAKILVPLAKIVLNREFIEKPMYRTTRTQQMISIFNGAFVTEYSKQPQSADFAKIKESYYQTVFAGCTRDLRRDCVNATLFAADGRNTMIMTMLARELDAPIEAQMKTAGSAALCIANSQECRNLVEERYRRLGMGVYKSNRYLDNDFSFAYLKYARLFSTFLEYVKGHSAPTDLYQSMSTSYMAEVHGKIFETIIAQYKPKSLDDPEFRSFVENFNPWGYSRKQADLFQYGTGTMFELGAQCCLYKDKSKTELNQGVRDAIRESQVNKDAFGLSFKQIVADVRKDHPDVFKKLGLGGLISEIERPNASFFNEYFFVVDRLFRGHLSSDEINMMLRNTNPDRARIELPKMISNYIKVYLVYMVIETNRFMRDIYKSDLASDQIFQQAVTRSRELTGRWYTIQAQIDLLDKLMNSYFKDSSIIESPDYHITFNLIRAVNRNVHYISAYPHMILMSYFLAKSKGTIEFNSWWGPIKVIADTIVKTLFDGGTDDVWFRFGKDVEMPDRLMLLYSLEYLLSTDSLDYFVDKDSSSQVEGTTERNKFFALLFNKYIGDSVDDMLSKVNDYQKITVGNPNSTATQQICDYEQKNAAGSSTHVTLNFLELGRFTYAGLGSNSYNKVLMDFLAGPADPIGQLLTLIESRRTYIHSMMDVIEGDLIRTKAIKAAGEPHADLDAIRGLLKKLDDAQNQLTQIFVTNHKANFDCVTKLHEIERRRANRLYDEERDYLGSIFDMMKPLDSINDDKELDKKAQEINAKFFTEASGYKFDRLDGKIYRMSKYDLFMRMKKRIESDIFMTPTDKERRNYGKDLNAYLKPRAVSVYIAEGITREEMYAQGTSASIAMHGAGDADRQDFIEQGLKMLSGQAGSFIDWQSQMESDVLSSQQYLRSLENFYLLPNAPGADPNLKITAEDLTNAYIKTLASYTLDAYDIEYSRVFGIYGHAKGKEFFQDIFFESDGTTKLPLFFSLMDQTVKMAGIDLDGSGPVQEALDLAKRVNSLQAWVFEPSPVVKASVKAVYGEQAHYRLNKVSELFAYLSKTSKAKNDATELDPRLAQPIYLENDQLTQWYQSGSKNLLDVQRFQDHKVRIGNFSQRTGNFYGTLEKVQVP